MALTDVRAIATLRSKVRVQAVGPLTGKNQILQGEQDRLIDAAVLDYSADEPRIFLLDLAEAALSDVAGIKHYLLASWDADVSNLEDVEIEWPIDQARRQILRRGLDLDWELVERPTGPGATRQWWIKFFRPPQDIGGNWRIRYAGRWPIIAEDATLSLFVPRQNEMVGLLSAVYTARFLAAHFGHTDDPTLAADVVAYRTKADEWKGLAEELWKEYQDRIDRPARVKRAGQTAGVVDLDLTFQSANRFGSGSFARDFLVHRRRRR